MLNFFFSLLSHDLGIDLGTANTLVYVKGKGILIREPSVVARHKKTKQVVAIGREAKKMLGKTPDTIEAIRAKLPIQESSGSFICDIGGGTTEIAVLALGGIVVNRSIRIAGDEMDDAIVTFIRVKYGILIGEPTAEAVKIAVGSAYPVGKGDRQAVVRGRDIETGLPRSIRVSESEIREALAPIIQEIVEAISETMEETPPE